MVALAILALTAVALLGQNGEAIAKAARSRDARVAWMLAAEKLGQLELDPVIWSGPGTGDNGDFADIDDDYREFTWRYEAVREPVEVGGNGQPLRKIGELFRLKLEVRAPGETEPVRLEALLPVVEANKQ
jgi:hypothetical protein